MIRVRDLEKRYGAVRAVRRVSFDVPRGQIVGLLGHNGAGKSTVMKVMTGYLEPTSGSVEVGGFDVLDDRIAVQALIGYLPESAPVYPEMLVQEYLLMVAELRGVEPEKCEAAVGRAVLATGLEDWLLRPVGTLSKGYRQRVGLAQAIVHEPDVLVLDEPSSGLDPVQVVEIRKLIRSLAERCTVILSTHVLSEIEAVCDRVIVMIDGTVAADGSLEELLASDRVLLSVSAGGLDVATALEKVAGVEGAARVGADPGREGFDVWNLRCDGNVPPTAAIVEAVSSLGLQTASIGSDRRNLEQVFRELMDRHVEEAGR